MKRLGLLLGVVAIAACGHDPKPAPAEALPTRQVKGGRAEVRTVGGIEEVVGTVRAVRSATIAATLGARVTEVHVTVGSKVEPGEVLVRLSAQEIEARVQQARAVLSLARLERDRAAKLVAAEAMSPAQYDAAEAQLRVAEAAQAEAATLSRHAVLRAPFAGVVTAKLVNVGDTAMPGTPLLLVEAPEALRFEARVPERAAHGLAAGRSLSVRIDGLDRELAGKVSEIDPAADAATRTVLVKVDLPHEPGLRSGRFGRLVLPSAPDDAVTVSPAAVVRRGQLEMVYVVDGGVARLRLVRTARQRDGEVEVVSGLAGGEQVAISDAAQLVDGQPIEVQP